MTNPPIKESTLGVAFSIRTVEWFLGPIFPIELANVFHGIHAAVTRQNHDNLLGGG